MFFGKRFSGYHKGRISGLEILVLSLIKNNRGLTGYDIMQKINHKFKGTWKASAGTIYPLLARLKENNLVKVKEIKEKNRVKKIYEISQKGSQELKDIMENKFIPSISILENFIETLLRASYPGNQALERISTLSFHPMKNAYRNEINESDTSIQNLNRIKKTIESLKKRRGFLSNKMKNIDTEIAALNELLNDLLRERDEKAKSIDIIEDDEEFEQF